MTGTAPGPSGALILPVRNAAPFLEGTLRAADAWLSSRPAPWEILVVDDGSSDGSGAIAERWLRDRGGPGEARLLRLASNRGKGFAVRAGILNARAPIVVFADCDLAYPLENVERLVAALGSGADAAIACRVLPGSTYRVSPSFFSYLYTRHAAGRLFNAVCRAVTLPGILDTQAGLKGFRAGAVRPLLDRLVLDGFSFDVELLRALADRGARIVEVPVDFRYDSEPTTTAFLGDSLRMARDLVRVRARSALGRYRRAEAAAASPRLVLHADDYGLAPGVNRAIEAALGSGAVTSASLLLGTPHAREAILWAKAHPELDFGVHLNLTRGRPVLPPGDNVYRQFGGLEITTSSTALQALTDAVLYLVAYPFECTEQLSSRILGVAALRDVLTAFEAEGLPSAAEMEAAVDRDIARLQALQRRLEASRAELALLEQAQEHQETAWQQHSEDLVRRRTGDNRRAGGSDHE